MTDLQIVITASQVIMQDSKALGNCQTKSNLKILLKALKMLKKCNPKTSFGEARGEKARTTKCNNSVFANLIRHLVAVINASVTFPTLQELV